MPRQCRGGECPVHAGRFSVRRARYQCALQHHLGLHNGGRWFAYAECTASDAAGNATTANPVTVTVSNGGGADTTPPTVTMTAPVDGAMVTGAAVPVSANAADNVGVASVQFMLDGSTLGAPDTSAPYSTTWDSTTVANGSSIR